MKNVKLQTVAIFGHCGYTDNVIIVKMNKLLGISKENFGASYVKMESQSQLEFSRRHHISG